jgi:putative ABC transport system ATP-binding protein
MIKLSDVSFRYPEGDFSLRVPALEIAPRESVALVGPSGSGKSTLLHIIAGIVGVQSGRVQSCGVDLSTLGNAARREFRIRSVGLVFQEFELLEYLSVLDNILLPYRIHPALRLSRDVRDRAAQLAEQVGIGDKLKRFATRLSQGEKQRVAVCRALIAEPVLLLADEPTGNLDPANTARVMDSLFSAAASQGATLVTVTHEHDLLERFDRVVDFGAFQAGETPEGSMP